MLLSRVERRPRLFKARGPNVPDGHWGWTRSAVWTAQGRSSNTNQCSAKGALHFCACGTLEESQRPIRLIGKDSGTKFTVKASEIFLLVKVQPCSDIDLLVLHIHTHTHAHTHVYTQTHTYTYTHTHKQTHVHARTDTRAGRSQTSGFKNAHPQGFRHSLYTHTKAHIARCLGRLCSYVHGRGLLFRVQTPQYNTTAL